MTRPVPEQSSDQRLASGRPFDPRRPRSAGPLDSEELAFCRERGIALAYDPRQIGWVVAGCRDDVFGLEEGDAPAPAQTAAAAAPTPQALFEERVASELARLDREPGAWPGVADAVWRMGESVVSEATGMRAPRRLALLRRLQQRAAKLIASRVVPEHARAALRQQARAGRERFHLRPWSLADLPRYRALLDDPAVWRHLPEPYPDPLDDDSARALIELSADTDRHDVLAIVFEGEPVGQVRLERSGAHVDPDAGEAEISYWLGAQHWGLGVMSDVLAAFTLRCLEESALTSIFARVAEENAASSRILEKAGYREEGPLRAELAGEPAMRTYRLYRWEYLGDRPEARPRAAAEPSQPASL